MITFVNKWLQIHSDETQVQLLPVNFASLLSLAAWRNPVLSQTVLRRPLWAQRWRSLSSVPLSACRRLHSCHCTIFVSLTRCEHWRSRFLCVWRSCQWGPCCCFYGNGQEPRGGEKSPRTTTSQGWKIYGINIDARKISGVGSEPESLLYLYKLLMFCLAASFSSFSGGPNICPRCNKTVYFGEQIPVYLSGFCLKLRQMSIYERSKSDFCVCVCV